jgi:protein tyrosine/serine phosphatase
MNISTQGLRSLRGFAAAGFMLMLALSAVLTSAQKVVTPPGIRNFGKVNEDYYRGSQPNKTQVQALKAMGVKTIIDLRKDFVPEERQWANETGLNYFNIPLKSHQRASKTNAEYFLKLVNDPANAPVYVHCKGGKHRTGALTAVYRISHDGWTADQAWEEMKKYDFNDNIFGGPADQKDFVFDFYKEFLTAKR